MAPRLIAMLTYNDMTVENALDLFKENKNAPSNHWGFKDVGIKPDEMKKLLKMMKEAGKTTFLEGLRESEKECLESAKLALEYCFDYFIGTIYYKSVNRLLKKEGVKYFPTCGKRVGIPRMLQGTIDDIIAHAKKLEGEGVDGICLSVYRYVDGGPEELAKRFVDAIDVPIIFSGGIKNINRLDVIKNLKPWGFTIGTAFFNCDFVKDSSISDQIGYIIKYLKE